jgi:hypothetical protein
VVDESVTPSGTVLTQDPVPGALVDPGTQVDIVLAQGPSPVEEAVAEVVAQVEAETPAPGTSTGSGTGVTPSAPPQLGVGPELPPAESINPADLKLSLKAPTGVFKLIQPAYRTVVEYDQFSANSWYSPALTFTDKPKRIWFTADGPLNAPCAVWTWGPDDTGWKLKTIWVAGPGAFEKEDGSGGTLVAPFDIGAGVYNVLVKVDPGVVWWKIKIEEQK